MHGSRRARVSVGCRTSQRPLLSTLWPPQFLRSRGRRPRLRSRVTTAQLLRPRFVGLAMRGAARCCSGAPWSAGELLRRIELGGGGHAQLVAMNGLVQTALVVETRIAWWTGGRAREPLRPPSAQAVSRSCGLQAPKVDGVSPTTANPPSPQLIPFDDAIAIDV